MFKNGKFNYIVFGLLTFVCCSCSNTPLESSLSFGQDELNMLVGQELDVSDLLDYSNILGEITYSLNVNNSVVNLNGSVIYAIDVGFCYVSASYGDLTDSLKIIVKEEVEASGTPDNPYLISTVEDLKTLSDWVLDYKDLSGVYFLQTNDIDISFYDNWTPIGTFGIPFEGVYDGNNKEVNGLKIDTTDSWQGLFGFSSGVIKNLTVRGDVKVHCHPDYVYSHSFCAGICGGLYNAAIVENCKNYANVHGDAYVGGIVGGIARSDEMIVGRNQSQIINCENYGLITGDDTYTYNEQAMYFGGICGESLGILTGNTNYGEVKVEGIKTRYVGGICGLGYTIYKYGMYFDEDLEKYSNNDNINYGKVSGYHSVGGVFGGNVLPSHNCENYGEISGSICVGGVSGLNGTSSILTNNYSVSLLENCKNYGTVNAKIRYAGGIASYSYFDVVNCLNDGHVFGGESSYGIGGIVGYQDYGTISDCVNEEHSLIEGYHTLGGIVGHSNTNSLYITGCVNKGSVNTFSNSDDEAVHIGGITGILGTNNTLENCSNYGEVKGKGTRNSPSRWGGIGGIAGSIYSSSKIFYSINYGHVEGQQQVGGIFGYSSGNSLTSVQFCLNYGKISSSNADPFLGGIAGRINGTSLFSNINEGVIDVVSGATHYGEIYGSAASSSVDTNKVSGDDYCPYFYLFSGGVGTKDDPFLIANRTDFEYLRERVSSDDSNSSQEGLYFKLTNDITITGGLLFNKEFAGDFDGNNHCLTINLELTKDNLSVFGINKGTISNLIVKGSLSGGNYLSGIAINNQGLIENCINETNITGSGSRIGGIASINKGIISNSINKGVITSNKQYVGGICGVNGDTSAKGIIVNCHNNNDVSSTSLTSLYATNGNCVGGIAGFSYCYEGTNISNCYNYGKISGISALGGIIGFTKTGSTLTFENLFNFGDVKGGVGVDEDKQYSGHIGGIVGMLGSNLSLKYVFNGGNVNGNGGQVSGNWRGVGGIAGSFYAGNIEYAYNFGNVDANMHAGGIVGYSQGTASKLISHCLSGGTITDSGENSGGILGRGNYTSISNCVSFGQVSSGSSHLIYGKGTNVTSTDNNTFEGSSSSNGLIKDIYYSKDVKDSKTAQIILDDINQLLLQKNEIDDQILALESFENKTFMTLIEETRVYLESIIGGENS